MSVCFEVSYQLQSLTAYILEVHSQDYLDYFTSFSHLTRHRTTATQDCQCGQVQLHLLMVLIAKQVQLFIWAIFNWRLYSFMELKAQVAEATAALCSRLELKSVMQTYNVSVHSYCLNFSRHNPICHKEPITGDNNNLQNLFVFLMGQS